MPDHDLSSFQEVEVELPAQHGFIVERSADGRWFTVVGACPTCRARTVFRVARGVLGPTKSLLGRRRPAPPAPRTLLVYCQCGFHHPDRPDSSPDTGCGAFWDVPVPPETPEGTLP